MDWDFGEDARMQNRFSLLLDTLYPPDWRDVDIFALFSGICDAKMCSIAQKMTALSL
jgi:hypothetical protein